MDTLHYDNVVFFFGVENHEAMNNRDSNANISSVLQGRYFVVAIPTVRILSDKIVGQRLCFLDPCRNERYRAPDEEGYFGVAVAIKRAIVKSNTLTEEWDQLELLRCYGGRQPPTYIIIVLNFGNGGKASFLSAVKLGCCHTLRLFFW